MFLGNFVYGADSRVYVVTDMNSQQQAELLNKIRSIGQPNGYTVTSQIRPGSKVIWLSSVNEPSMRQGYVKLWDHVERNFEQKSIFLENSFFVRNSLESHVSSAIRDIAGITVDQRNAISNIVHCLRSGKIQYDALNITYSDECRCCIQ